MPQHLVEQHSISEGHLEIRSSTSAPAEVSVLINREENLFVDHRWEPLLVSLPLFCFAANHIARIASKLERRRIIFHIGTIFGCVQRQALCAFNIEVPARGLVPVFRDAVEGSP